MAIATNPKQCFSLCSARRKKNISTGNIWYITLELIITGNINPPKQVILQQKSNKSIESFPFLVLSLVQSHLVKKKKKLINEKREIQYFQ